MSGNFVHCDNCGATFELHRASCPVCGTAVQRKKSTEQSVKEMRFSGDILPLKSLLSMFGSVALLVVGFVVFAMIANGVMVERAPSYGPDYVVFFKTLVTSHVICAALLIISSILVLLRLRLSFIIMIGASVISLVVFLLVQLWGTASGYMDLSAYLIAMTIGIMIPIIKECIGCNTLVNRSEPKEEDDSKKPVGAAMPKVQELYSFEDMPELSGMRGLEETLEQQDAEDKDDKMDEVVPVGVEQTRSAAPVFIPTEVDHSEGAVQPLTDTRGEATAENGGVVAISALERPMFAVDMMDTEAMPAIGGDVPSDAPAMTAAADMSAPDVPKSAGIWFCPVCGSLNENVHFCNTCGKELK